MRINVSLTHPVRGEWSRVKRSWQLVLVITFVLIAVAGIVFLIAPRGDGWRKEASFTGTASGGQSTSPDDRWDLNMVWLRESAPDGSPRLQLHLTDRQSAQHFTQTIVISDPEVEYVNDSGRQRVRWEVDSLDRPDPGMLGVGSEVVRLPQ
jgi:hypothetical protein